jgi:hypothetical protein
LAQQAVDASADELVTFLRVDTDVLIEFRPPCSLDRSLAAGLIVGPESHFVDTRQHIPSTTMGRQGTQV